MVRVVLDQLKQAVRCKDKKGINFISNCHDPHEITSVNRTQRDGAKKVVPCPSLVKDYNALMGCVDKADQLKEVYAIDRRSKKWWSRIFFHFLDTTIVNAYVIYSLNIKGLGKALSLKAFRLSIVRALCGVPIPNQVLRGRRSALVEKNKRIQSASAAGTSLR